MSEHATLVIVRGGGDLGSGVAARLARSGYRVVVLETVAPAVVRRKVAFAQAVFGGSVRVEELTGTLVSPEETAAWLGANPEPRMLPVVIDPDGELIDLLAPGAVVDARMAKRNLGTKRDDARVTIGLGPGFEAGVDVDAVIETNRGHSLGRVLGIGSAEADTGVPAPVDGVAEERLIRASASGRFEGTARIGHVVSAGDVVGTVDGVPVEARASGLVRGLVADGLVVREAQKIGDVDPRGSAVDPAAISDKALAIGGGVLEALMSRGVLPTLPE